MPEFMKRFWAHARFEILTLMRSWFFRIFAFGSTGMLLIFNLVVFSTFTDVPRVFRDMSAFMPFINVFFLTIAQSLVLLFLTTDILKRERKLNSTQVIYIHSMTNMEYLTGKILGILLLFSSIIVLNLMLTALIHIVFTNINFRLSLYLIYPLLIALPAMLFILGLSLFLMRLIKNQAVTIFLVLGYLSLTVFYLRDNADHFFDVLCISLPLIASDFTGISELNGVLVQRSIYLLIGTVFILVTALLFPRLAQSNKLKIILPLSATLLLAVTTLLSYQYIERIAEGEILRRKMTALNEEYLNRSGVTPLEYEINVRHIGKEIEVEVKIKFRNENDRALEKYFFSLNPGFRITKVHVRGNETGLSRVAHLIEIYPAKVLLPGASDSMEFVYRGRPDDAACYLDIDRNKRRTLQNIWLYKFSKKYSFVEPDYVLLTGSSLWYPVAGLPVSMTFPQNNNKNFCRYTILVKTNKDLTAIAQGKEENPEPGNFRFSPEKPLPTVSLIIGNYQRDSVIVEDITYNLYRHRDHDYYQPYFTDIRDTLKSVIKELKQDYTNKLQLNYPFNRFSIVEVPLQFYAHQRVHTEATGYVLPEQCLLPENALFYFEADFKLMSQRMDYVRSNIEYTMTDIEKQVNMFKRFMETVIGGDSFRGLKRSGMISDTPNLNPFPNFYTHAVHFHSRKIPLLDRAFESYLYNRINVEESRADFFDPELTEAEKVSRVLKEHSLKEVLQEWIEPDILPAVLTTKSKFLINILKSKANDPDFDAFINQIVEDRQFKSMPAEQVIAEVSDKYGFNMETITENWYENKHIPGFLYDHFRMFKIIKDEQEKYQLLFEVTNPEPADGYLDVTFLYRGPRRFGRGRFSGARDETVRFIRVPAGKALEVGIVLDSQPRLMLINPTIARNIPLIYSRRFEDVEERPNFSAFDGSREIDSAKQINSGKELIVDNDSPGFSYTNSASGALIKRWLFGDNEHENEFYRFNFWRVPNRWVLWKNADFYGTYVRSARIIGSGEGERHASWTTNIPESGYYEVYTYNYRMQMMGRRFRDRKLFGTFHYTIEHDDGSDKIAINTESAREGWNLLGTFYFSKGSATVTLSDKSNLRLVFADAVKWVRR